MKEQEKAKKYSINGTISTTAKGVGFVDAIKGNVGKGVSVGKSLRSKDGDSIHIEEGLLNTALNGDLVEVSVEEKRVQGKLSKEGRVVKVIKRAKENFVGITKLEENTLVVVPDDKKMYTNFVIQKADNKSIGVSENFATSKISATPVADDKVYVKMLSWNNPVDRPLCKVIRILGKKGNNDVEMESIVLESGFTIDFPRDVEKETEIIAKNNSQISAEEIAKRRDMRGVLTFTIDPFDAKDFDDAISFRRVENGEIETWAKSDKNFDQIIKTKKPLYEIGVHIADVSHYVTEGSALDKEAIKRGCSIYLVDRTIPMLPEILSNELCSLNPGADKLSFSAIFIIDENAKIYRRWFGRTVINSDYRFTYESAQAVLDNSPEAILKYSNNIHNPDTARNGLKYRNELLTLNNIAKILQKEKFRKGAIEFEQEEIKFRLDENGKPVGVIVKERLDTHKLVEEYMLLANREVAKYISDSIKRKGKKDTGSIYRIHDVPDKDKIANLSIFVKALGYDLKTKDGEVTARDFNNLLNQIEDTPHEALIRVASIRSMQKAVYSTKNIGHFGLAFEYYTHFTSPIRRYPDLLVHRILNKHLNGEPFSDREIVKFQQIADSSTDREIDAADAERASKKLKQVEYMSTRVGQIFEGIISGVTKWGIYVEEVETKSEGMIALRNLVDDYYIFDQKTYSVFGEKTKKKFTLGDKVKFKVLSADLDKRTLDFGIVL